MSTSSQISLGALRLLTQQRADMENNPTISTQEWNQYLSQSWKELYDLLVAAYGNDYFVASPYPMTIYSNQFYQLPVDFYKLLGVDLQYSSSPTGWVSLKRFEFLERNKYAYLQPAVNAIAQTVQIWYVPQATSLQFNFVCSTESASAVIQTVNVAGLTVGMNVYGSGVPSNTTILNINTVTNSVTLTNPCTATSSATVLQFWDDATLIDCVNGWEEFIIVDGCIKSGTKQDFDISAYQIQKQALKERLEAMAEGRDAGQAHHVTDAMCVNSWGYNQLGAASLRYRLVGSQLMLIPIAADTDMDYGWMGGYS